MMEELKIRVDERAKELAEKVLSAQGVSLSTAINRFLCAIAVTHSLPYKEDIPLPEDNKEKKSKQMSLEELGKQVLQNYAGPDGAMDAKMAFAEIEKRYGL